MRAKLQEGVDGVDATQYEAVLLGYALCGNGVAGLESRTLPLVVPRAHDCIALPDGRAGAVPELFREPPGRLLSLDWLAGAGEDLEQATRYTLEALIARYGEGTTAATCSSSSMRYHAETTGNWHNIATGLGAGRQLRTAGARKKAARRGWQFETIRGDLRLFERLVAVTGTRPIFLVVPPGWRVKPTYDETVIDKEQ